MLVRNPFAPRRPRGSPTRVVVDCVVALSSPPQSFVLLVAKWNDLPKARRSPPSPAQPRQPQHRLYSAERDELVQRYQAGERAKDLALAYGVHRVTVAEIAKRAGVRHPAAMSPLDIQQATRLYAEGMSCARIGQRLGWHANTIWRALRAQEIAMRGPHDRP